MRINLPAEWEQQNAIMLTWPNNQSYWQNTMHEIENVFQQVAIEVSKRQKLIISCFDVEHKAHILTLLQKSAANLSNVSLNIVKANDIWVRDHGPITVLKDNKPLLLDFTFTGWGYKYPAKLDNELTKNLHTQQVFNNTPIKTIDFAIEGGGIETDGKGTLLVTKSCILCEKRNPQLSQDKVEEILKTNFGVNRILWLENGELEGDDTDGHIDTLVRFADPHTLLYVTCDNEADANFTSLNKMAKELQNFKDYQGKPYNLIPLPSPKIKYADFDGKRLPLTYANFLIINNAVLVPTYNDANDANDALALKIISETFKDREIIAIPSMPVVQWYGSIHCMTMQLPRGVL